LTLYRNSEIISTSGSAGILNLTVKDAVVHCRLTSYVYDLLYTLIWDFDRQHHSHKLYIFNTFDYCPHIVLQDGVDQDPTI